MPKLSVILSVYNHEIYIKKCIQSIVDQTFKEWELIAIDDGSNDNSYYELIQFEKKDKRIKVFKNKKNLGLPKSLNLCIQKTQTNYIVRADADDNYFSNRFEELYTAITSEGSSNIDVIGSNANFINSAGDIIGLSKMPLNPNEFAKEIFMRNPFIHSSVIIKKSFLIENNFYDEKLIKAQDYDLWLRGFKINNFKNLDKKLLNLKYINSKSIKSDYYSFYVFVKNCFKKKNILSTLYFSTRHLFILLIKKFGYKSKSLN